MNTPKMIPIYTSSGDLGAYLVYPYLYSRNGEWIGFITRDKEVYSVMGRYVGYLAEGPRVLRKKSHDFDRPPAPIPPVPGRLRVPASVPLAPMMKEVPFTDLDVLDEMPELLHTLDTGELRQDMD